MTLEQFNVIANKVIETRLGFTVFGCNTKCPLWYHCETRNNAESMPCELSDEDVLAIKAGRAAEISKPLSLPRTYQVQLWSDDSVAKAA
jgi:glucan biosynthesis protein